MVSAEAFSVINALDLDPIKQILLRRKAEQGWTQKRADAAEREYRRFLCMVKMYPDTPIVPAADVETFWYQHILNTRKYADDCERAFGYFVHHFPYIGLRGNEDKETLERLRVRTEAIYEQVFGEACLAALPPLDQEARAAYSVAVRLSTAYGSPASIAARAAPWASTHTHPGDLASAAGSQLARSATRAARSAMPGGAQAAEYRPGFYLERPRPS